MNLGLTPGRWRYVTYTGEYSVPHHDVVTDYDDERMPKRVANVYHGNANDIRVMALAKEMAEAIIAFDECDQCPSFGGSEVRLPSAADCDHCGALLLDLAEKLREIAGQRV